MSGWGSWLSTIQEKSKEVASMYKEGLSEFSQNLKEDSNAILKKTKKVEEEGAEDGKEEAIEPTKDEETEPSIGSSKTTIAANSISTAVSKTGSLLTSFGSAVSSYGGSLLANLQEPGSTTETRRTYKYSRKIRSKIDEFCLHSDNFLKKDLFPQKMDEFNKFCDEKEIDDDTIRSEAEFTTHMEACLANLVPDQISREKFWHIYLFALKQIIEEETRKEEMLKRTASSAVEEEDGWGDDDDEDHETTTRDEDEESSDFASTNTDFISNRTSIAGTTDNENDDEQEVIVDEDAAATESSDTDGKSDLSGGIVVVDSNDADSNGEANPVTESKEKSGNSGV
eukprot:CAMPEP_0114980222 /NCGR_PEP_ID=MMETSP0216-20121206/4835_1 /TAXON_ID=223996 /ORGANISM="Protocruzia adherens, Strain Boccale" /LENGTH=339 /DNA_ID=CAMNT_0002341691 /DNA_START=34 /DNA_END=1054 /DNA_ORIENTATION=-